MVDEFITLLASDKSFNKVAACSFVSGFSAGYFFRGLVALGFLGAAIDRSPIMIKLD